MTFSTKAIFTALILSLTPAVASAQGIGHFGNGGIFGMPAINLGINPQVGLPGMPVTPWPVRPVQVMDCGAHQYQAFVGQHVHVMQRYGVQARYFTPNSPYGTTDYNPRRLNVSTNAHYVIDRVYCG